MQEFLDNKPVPGVPDVSIEPFYPILDVGELGAEPVDIRGELPPDIQAQLQSWEVVVHINKPRVIQPGEHPSALSVLKQLTGVEGLEEIGEHGPSIASLSSQENRGVEALTKYEVVHGRDSLQIALDSHRYHPRLLRQTILALAEQQGVLREPYVTGVPFRHERPGQIMLLNRAPEDPIGRKFSEKLGWGFPFYGSIDATPSFISAIATYVQEHDASFLHETYMSRDGQTRTIADSLNWAVRWLVDEMGQNYEGLLEFKNLAAKGGMLNQAWKDSAAAYVHANGDWANHESGIASVEVQALAYDALMDASGIYRGYLSKPAFADYLRQKAAGLRIEVLGNFWTEDKGGYFVLGTDRDQQGNLRQMRVRTSNMGRLLNSSILMGKDYETQRKKEAVVAQMLSPELRSPYGIRTLAKDEAAYRPFGYHIGVVWPHDTNYIADGLERHQYTKEAWDLRNRTSAIVALTKRFPEFVQGGDDPTPQLNECEIYVYDKKYGILHLVMQPEQEWQGWAVSAELNTRHRRNILRNPALTWPESLRKAYKLGSVAT